MNKLFTRRNIVIGASSAAVLAAATYEGVRLIGKRRAPTPYDDLLARLDDRDADAQIGEAVLAGFDNFDPKAVAAELRQRLEHKSLSELMLDDVRGGRVMEAGGWVLPETLALLCALAAKAEA